MSDRVNHSGRPRTVNAHALDTPIQSNTLQAVAWFFHPLIGNIKDSTPWFTVVKRKVGIVKRKPLLLPLAKRLGVHLTWKGVKTRTEPVHCALHAVVLATPRVPVNQNRGKFIGTK